jgi:uncharacterized Zn finger protein
VEGEQGMTESENQNLSPLEQKARDYLLRGKVAITSVVGSMVHAEVTGSDETLEPYRVVGLGVEWRCDCPARVPECAHIIAVRLVSPAPIANGVKALFADARDPDIDKLLEGL